MRRGVTSRRERLRPGAEEGEAARTLLTAQLGVEGLCVALADPFGCSLRERLLRPGFDQLSRDEPEVAVSPPESRDLGDLAGVVVAAFAAGDIWECPTIRATTVPMRSSAWEEWRIAGGRLGPAELAVGEGALGQCRIVAWCGCQAAHTSAAQARTSR